MHYSIIVFGENIDEQMLPYYEELALTEKIKVPMDDIIDRVKKYHNVTIINEFNMDLYKRDPKKWHETYKDYNTSYIIEKFKEVEPKLKYSREDWIRLSKAHYEYNDSIE